MTMPRNDPTAHTAIRNAMRAEGKRARKRHAEDEQDRAAAARLKAALIRTPEEPHHDRTRQHDEHR